MLFEILPEVSNCCCCFSLQYGLIFIALFVITINLVSLFKSTVVVCYVGIRNAKCDFEQQHIYNLSAALIYLYIVPSLLLIIGVFLKKRILVTFFLYCYLVASVAEVVSDMVVVMVSAYFPHCGIGMVSFVTCLSATALQVCLSMYFIIVVKSFRSSISGRCSVTLNRGESNASVILVNGKRIHVDKANVYTNDTRPTSSEP